MLYPIGIQNFEKMRTGGFVYVDKTAQIYKLAATGSYYFLSRPRRFGKSLLVSTMEAYFQGRKELFKGLAIEKLEKNWTASPVLHLDLTWSRYTSVADLAGKFDQHLLAWESQFGVTDRFEEPAARFAAVIEAAYRKVGNRVVILIDEYDKPVVDNIDNPELMDSFRRELQGFYSVIKGKDGFIRFAFLTGVTKLGKMSVFSSLNNLMDISMDLRYSDICGVSEDELKSYFDDSVEKLAENNELTKNECYAKLKAKYGGYHFCENVHSVYNPSFLLNCFRTNEFGSFLYESQIPEFITHCLKLERNNLNSITEDCVPSWALIGTNSERLNPITLMYQTGYLTIKGYDSRFNAYNLDYPNEEVAAGFLHSLSQLYAPALIGDEFSVYSFVDDIERGDVDSFMTRFTAFLSGNDYEIQGDLELYFQNTMSVMLKMMGLYVKTEYHTSRGRIDIIFDTDKYVYIIELKRDQSPEIALKQIEEKGYDKPFLASGKQIIKLGINFSSETHTVDGWLVG